jgi:hypothetical protein
MRRKGGRGIEISIDAIERIGGAIFGAPENRVVGAGAIEGIILTFNLIEMREFDVESVAWIRKRAERISSGRKERVRRHCFLY